MANPFHKLGSPRRRAPGADHREGFSRQSPICFYHTHISLAARGPFLSLRKTRHRLACAGSLSEGTNQPGKTISRSERSRWEKKRGVSMNVRAVWPFYTPFRPSSSRVKSFNWDRASRVDDLLWADLPNDHTTPPPSGARASHLPFLLVIQPPRWERPCF